MNNIFNKFDGLFLLLMVLEIAVSNYAPSYTIIAKPLLLGSLFIYLMFQSGISSSIKIPTAFALLFSLAGDVFLIFGELPNYFMAGLVSFLLAHLCYIVVFRKQADKNKSVVNVFSLLMLAFGMGYFVFLYPHLNELTIPVACYLIVILIMAISANLRRNLNNSFFKLGVIGALLFVASDSFLAYNSFVSPFVGANLLIMTSYALAQLFILKSILQIGGNSTH